MDFGAATNRVVGRKIKSKAGLKEQSSLKRPTGEKLKCEPDKIHLYLNVQFYKYPPLENIPLTEFDDFAESRLKRWFPILNSRQIAVLRDVETCRQRAGKDRAELEKLLDAVLIKTPARFNDRIAQTTRPGASPLGTSLDVEQVAQRRRDHISHYILRLALCKTLEQQRWMETQELALFRWRWSKESAHNQRLFLDVNDIEFERVNEEQQEKFAEELRVSTPLLKGQPAEKHTFWRVPMLQAIELVRRRRVFVRDRHAYVHNDDMIDIIAGKFAENLARGLNLAQRHYSAVTDEPLIVPVLARVAAKTSVGEEACGEGDATSITPAMVARLSETTFPLCMRSLQTSLDAEHHLKYGGRQQYGLFLKALGMSLDGALTFFRAHFTKIVDADKFDKQYTYNIRHQYGKEGKRTNYTAMSCAQIQAHMPGVGDNHGCPFKHWGHEQLRDKLKALDVDETRAKTILSEAQSGHLDRACTRFFEATHMLPETALQSTKGLVAHPNKYQEWSVDYRAGKIDTAAAAEDTASQMTIVASQPTSQSQQTVMSDKELEDLLQ